jgi:hypothetical protein
MNEKTILIKFPNSDWFEVPLAAIAKHRANYYSNSDDFEEGSKEWQDEIDYVMKSPYEGLDWVQNNMDWDEIEELGEFVNAEPYDYSDGFLDAEFEILNK